MKLSHLAVFIGKKGRIRPDVNWVTVRLQEEDGASESGEAVTHGFDKNHVDYTFDLGGSWRKLLCEFPGGGGDAQVVPGAFETGGSPKEEGPPGLHQVWMFCTRAQSVSSGSPLRYSNVAWNTATEQSGVAGNGLSATSTTLLGHNGRHTVRIVAWGGGNAGGAWSQSADSPQGLGDFPFEQQTFDGTAWEPQGFNNALPVVGRNVQNLVIKKVETSNGTQDYFKFDADSENNSLTHPTVTFEIEDKGDKHRYQWWLWVTPTTDEPNSVAFTGIMNSDGEKTVTINASNPQGYTQEHPLTEWGTYTFDLRIKEIKTNSEEGIGEPWVDLRSDKLKIPYAYTDAQGASHRGHKMEFVAEDNSDETKVKVNYYLEDSEGVPLTEARNATSGQVELFDGEMESKATLPMETDVRAPREDVELYTFTGNELGSIYRAMFTAEDGHAEDYRDHQNKRMRPANQTSVIKTFHIEDDWMEHPTLGELNPLARDADVNEAFIRPEMPDNKTPWTRSNIIWTVGNADNDSPHVGSAVCGVVTPYQWLGTTSARYNYSEGNDPANGQPRFHNKNISNSNWNSAHAQRRFVHVIGAGYSTGPGDGEYGWSDSGHLHDLFDTLDRYSYTFVLEVKGSTPSSQATYGVVGTTIHEIGHQFATEDDHKAPEGSSAISGIPEEEQAMQDAASSDPIIKAQGLKNLALYNGGLKPGISVATKSGDFRNCVETDDLLSAHIFCEYHKHIIDTYTGW